MAAYRAGVRTVLIPRENLKDLEDVSPTVRERIDIRPVDDVAEVIRAALVCEPPVIADTPLELPPYRPAAGETRHVQRSIIWKSNRELRHQPGPVP